MAKCRYCSANTQASNACSKSQPGYHVVSISGKRVYCGVTTRAGGDCSRNPDRPYHVVDAGLGKCIYCAAITRAGGSCIKSPSGGHVMDGGLLL